MQSEQQQRIMGYFIEEAKDHLNTIEQGLLNLQSTIEDPEMANEVFRAAHSVKGGAAMLGLDSIQKTSHRLEDYFKVLKECPLQVDQKLETFLLRVFDTLQELLEQLQGPFGLSDDKARDVMAAVEPVFRELNQHLSRLVAQSGGTTPSDVDLSPPGLGGASASSSSSAVSQAEVQQFFQREVPMRLRDMLHGFKQPDQPLGRQRLQALCQDLAGAGERFGLPGWSHLLDVTQRAIANSENRYRVLAPLIIKELKQAQEQVLSNRSGDIHVSQALLDLGSVVAASASKLDEPDLDPLITNTSRRPASAASGFPDLDLDADLDSTAHEYEVTGNFDWQADPPEDLDSDEWFTDLEALQDVDISDQMARDLEVEDIDRLDSSLDLEFSDLPDVESEPTLPPPTTSHSGSSHSGLSHPVTQTGPEVGMAELNSLADLFETEVPELGMSWQEEDSLGQVSDSWSESLEFDESSDFSDLLFDQDGTSSDTTTGSEEALSGLLNLDEFDIDETSNDRQQDSDLTALDELVDSLDAILDGSELTRPGDSADELEEIQQNPFNLGSEFSSSETDTSETDTTDALDDLSDVFDQLDFDQDIDSVDAFALAADSAAIDSLMEPVDPPVNPEAIAQSEWANAEHNDLDALLDDLSDDLSSDGSDHPFGSLEAMPNEVLYGDDDPMSQLDPLELQIDDSIGDYSTDMTSELSALASAGSESNPPFSFDDLDITSDLWDEQEEAEHSERDMLDAVQPTLSSEAGEITLDEERSVEDGADHQSAELSNDLNHLLGEDVSSGREMTGADGDVGWSTDLFADRDPSDFDWDSSLEGLPAPDPVASASVSDSEPDDSYAGGAEDVASVPHAGEEFSEPEAGRSPDLEFDPDTNDFADLDALLDDEFLSMEMDEAYDQVSDLEESNLDTPDILDSQDAISITADAVDEFDDLERLLADADKTLGGPPTSMTSRRSLQPTARRPGRRGVLTDQTMRVSVKHLDNLNNLVGELVVNRNSLEQAQERLRQFLDNLLYQVQQLGDVGQRMKVRCSPVVKLHIIFPLMPVVHPVHPCIRLGLTSMHWKWIDLPAFILFLKR
jgi:chemotaxis protein histidine kinase CheA